MTGRLEGRRALVTSADRYMGPAIVERFRAEGADVVADTADYRSPGVAEGVVAAAGPLDVLVANLAEPPRLAPAHEIDDADWFALFDALVHPLMRLVRAALPPMLDRGYGRVVAVTSASPLRGIPRASGYSAARGAQNAFIRAVGAEVAPKGVAVNAIAQNYIENDTYYPPELLADEAMLQRMRQAVPARRLGRPEETAELAVYLASDAAGFLVGQAIPLAGGWAT